MPAFARENPIPYSNIFVEALNSSLYFSSVATGTSTVAPEITYFLKGPGWGNLNAETALEGAMAAWAAVANVTFRQVSAANASTTWTQELYRQANSGILGQHFLPNNDGLGGEFNAAHPIFTAASNMRGGLSYVTFLHELGHGLGLQHPFESPPFPGVGNSDPYDPGDFNFNNGIYTVMGYDDAPFFADPGTINFGYAGTPMAFDIAAIQAIYGPNRTTAAGDTVYTLPTANAAGTFWSTIWDVGGNDTIRVGNGATTGATIDLRAATLRVEPGGGGWESRVAGIFGGVLIANTVVIENAIGTDFNDILRGNDVANLLQGLDGSDQLFGGGGNDRLFGGSGADTLRGELGDDEYTIDAGDIVLELANGGYDTIRSTLTNYTLTANVERLLLGIDARNGTGNSFANIIDGNAFGNQLNGASGNDTIRGFAGNDVIDGGPGLDSLYGGFGNDRYFADVSNERLYENSGEGTDTVFASVSFTLASELENLTLFGNAANGTGNDLANTVLGNGAANVLRGLAGDDVLRGASGNDILFGGTGRDEFTGGAGRDYFAFETGDMPGVAGNIIDYIRDFNQSEADRVDLRRLDAILGGTDHRFTFIDTAEFGDVAGELRYEVRGANTFIEGDTNGDGVADFAIRLVGIYDLVGADFLL